MASWLHRLHQAPLPCLIAPCQTATRALLFTPLHCFRALRGACHSIPSLRVCPFSPQAQGLPSPLVTRLFKSQAQTVHTASIKQVKLFLSSLPPGEGGRLPVQVLEEAGCSPERPNHDSPRLFVVFDPGHPVLKCIFQLLKRGLCPRHQQFVQKTKMLVYLSCRLDHHACGRPARLQPLSIQGSFLPNTAACWWRTHLSLFGASPIAMCP